MSNLVLQAKMLAIGAHEALGQKRKYTGEPYWKHPERVASMIRSVLGDDAVEALTASWLHDVPEDTKVGHDTIFTLFGKQIGFTVYYACEVSTGIDGNRAERKRKDREHYAMGNSDSKNIKVADAIDNIPSIVVHDPEFAATYLDEKELLLGVLEDEAHPVLVQRLRQLIKDSRKLLGKKDG